MCFVDSSRASRYLPSPSTTLIHVRRLLLLGCPPRSRDSGRRAAARTRTSARRSRSRPLIDEARSEARSGRLGAPALWSWARVRAGRFGRTGRWTVTEGAVGVCRLSRACGAYRSCVRAGRGLRELTLLVPRPPQMTDCCGYMQSSGRPCQCRCLACAAAGCHINHRRHATCCFVPTEQGGRGPPPKTNEPNPDALSLMRSERERTDYGNPASDTVLSAGSTSR